LVAEDPLKVCPICNRDLRDPRTLPCLHSFCLQCLEDQVIEGSPPCCSQCRFPFTVPEHGGIGALECNPFIGSLTFKTLEPDNDVNRVVTCDGCQEEDAVTHCVECGEYLGSSCSAVHKRLKATAQHQQVALEVALAGMIPAVKRTPVCGKHAGLETDAYCKTCEEAVCAKCAITDHRTHTVCPLDEIGETLWDEIENLTISATRREQEARESVSRLEMVIGSQSDLRTTVENEIAATFAELRAVLDAREALLLGELYAQGDLLRKTASRDKDEVEFAALELRDFCSFTEGLLAEGTPHEIAMSRKQVRARGEALDSLKTKVATQATLEATIPAAKVATIKKAISALGSISM